MGYGRAVMRELEEEGYPLDDMSHGPHWVLAGGLGKFPDDHVVSEGNLELAGEKVVGMAVEAGKAALKTVGEKGKLLSLLSRLGITNLPVVMEANPDGTLFVLYTEEGNEVRAELSSTGDHNSPGLVIRVADDIEHHDSRSIAENVDSKMKLDALDHYCRKLAGTLAHLETYYLSLREAFDQGKFENPSLFEDPCLEEFDAMVEAFQILELLMGDDSMRAMVGHMIKSPMKPIVTGNLLTQSAMDKEQFQQGLLKLRNGMDRLGIILTKYVPKLIKEGLGLAPMNLSEGLAEMQDYMRESSNVNLEFDCPDDLDVLMPKWVFISLLENLCINAVKAGAKNVRVEVLIEGTVVKVRVHDDCLTPIPDHVLDNLFQSPVEVSLEGSGSGLLIAQKLMADLKGILAPSTKTGDLLAREHGLGEAAEPYYNIRMHQVKDPEYPQGQPREKYVEGTFPLVKQRSAQVSEAPVAAAA